MKEFLGQDYRTAARLLADSPDLQQWIGLAHPPHYTTLHKASKRLLRDERAHRLLLRQDSGPCHRPAPPAKRKAPRGVNGYAEEDAGAPDVQKVHSWVYWPRR